MRYPEDLGKITDLLTSKYGKAIAEGTHRVRDGAIDRLIRERATTQSSVALRSGVDQPRISKMKRGYSKLRKPLRFEAAALYAVAACLECDFEDLADLPLNSSRFYSTEQIDDVREKLQQVALVRTIDHTAEPCHLKDIYFRTRGHTRDQAESEAIELDGLHRFPTGLTVIEGQAGQGKSILLRHLAFEASRSGHSLPLFIELRHLEQRELRDAIRETVAGLGLDLPRKKFKQFMLTGQPILLLDAFDEVSNASRKQLILDIERLIESFPKVKVVLSSRPNEFTNYFTNAAVYWICKLESHEVEKVINLYATSNESTLLLERLKEVDAKPVSEVLTTPLNVLLLVIHFRYRRSVPESVIDFYRDLFDVMVRRHNLSERGAKRTLMSALDSHELRVVFQAFCFTVAVKAPGSSVLRGTAENWIGASLQLRELFASASDVLSDFHNVAALLVEEGGRYDFVHRTVQEFFAAEHVAAASDKQAKVFYRSVYTSPDIECWGRILQFLITLDELRIHQYLIVPILTSFAPFSLTQFLSQVMSLEMKTEGGTTYIYLDMEYPVYTGRFEQISDYIILRIKKTMPVVDLTGMLADLKEFAVSGGDPTWFAVQKSRGKTKIERRCYVEIVTYLINALVRYCAELEPVYEKSCAVVERGENLKAFEF